MKNEITFKISYKNYIKPQKEIRLQYVFSSGSTTKTTDEKKNGKKSLTIKTSKSRCLFWPYPLSLPFSFYLATTDSIIHWIKEQIIILCYTQVFRMTTSITFSWLVFVMHFWFFGFCLPSTLLLNILFRVVQEAIKKQRQKQRNILFWFEKLVILLSQIVNRWKETTKIKLYNSK